MPRDFLLYIKHYETLILYFVLLTFKVLIRPPIHFYYVQLLHVVSIIQLQNIFRPKLQITFNVNLYIYTMGQISVPNVAIKAVYIIF